MTREKYVTDREMLQRLRGYFQNKGVKCSEFARGYLKASRGEAADEAVALRDLHDGT